MRPINIRLDLCFSRRARRGALTAALLAAFAPVLDSEDIKMSTYYPSPSGVYVDMISTDDTFLARDGGQVAVGGSALGSAKLSVMAGNVGIGTNNAVIRMDVVGGADGNGVNVRSNTKIETGSGIYLNGPNPTQLIGQQSATEVGVWNTGAWGLTFSNNGSVGVGISPSPGMRLDVNGEILHRDPDPGLIFNFMNP